MSLAWVAGSLTPACTEPAARTTFSAWIDADSEVRALVVEVDVRIDSRRGDDGPWDFVEGRTFEAEDGSDWPLTMRVGPLSANTSLTYQLVATAKDSSGAIVAQARARGTYDQLRRTGLRVQFEASCVRRTTLCLGGLTCSGGQCVEATPTPEVGPRPNMPSPMDMDAGSKPEMIATQGDACETEGARACAGFGTRSPLSCQDGVWAPEPQCEPTQRCDSTDGTCRPIARECTGRESGVQFCDAEKMRVCNRDLTASAIRPCDDNELCVTTASGMARCECGPGFADDSEMAACVQPSSCAQDNGGCDRLTVCNPRSGGPTCSPCPSGYDGNGETGCLPKLVTLTASEGDLTPAFSPEITSYRLRVPLLVQRVAFRATAPTGARLLINGAAPEADGSWTSSMLTVGDNMVDAVLTTESGGARTYSIVIERTGEQVAYVKPDNPDDDLNFGLALQSSGDTAVAGAPYDDSTAKGINGNPAETGATDSGAVWVYARNGDRWVKEAYLKASDTSARALFGFSVSIDGDTIVVGAMGHDPFTLATPTRDGAAYVFVRSGGVWSQQAKLEPNDPAPGQLFGYSVAVSGDTIAVGANLESTGQISSGAVYVFTRSGTTWSFKQKIKPAEPHANAQFSSMLSLSGDVLAVSAGEDATAARRAGAAYVFERENGMFTERARFSPDPAIEGAAFGYGIDVHGDRLAVGAPRFVSLTGNPMPAGEVYVYERTASGWARTDALKAPAPAQSDWFGSSVSISDAALLVGSAGDSAAPGLATQGDQPRRGGGAYLYARAADGWELTTFLKAQNPEANDRFGLTVAMSEDAVVIGAPYEDNRQGGIDPESDQNAGSNSGAIYLFR